MAGNAPELRIIGSINKDATRKAIQADLDKISKSLTLTIGVGKKGNTDLGKSMKEQSDSVTKSYKKMGDANAEFSIKFAKSLEKRESLQRKLSATQDKYINKVKIDSEKEIALKERLIAKYNELQTQARRNVAALEKYKLNTEEESSLTGYATDMKNLGDVTNKSTKELQSMVTKAHTATKGIRDLGTEVKASGRSALKFGEYLTNAFKGFGTWSIVTVTWYAAVNALKNGVQAVVDLDKAMLELRKVTDITNEGMTEFLKVAGDVGEGVGRTTTDVVKATSEFAKMGYSISESLRLGEDALILQNVGDGIDTVAQSTEILISTLKGFNMEAQDSRMILDSLNEVANAFALGTDDLSEGIKRVASVASVAGASFEQTLGMLTAMTEVSQNAEKSSTALKTLTMRLQGLSDEGDSLGGNFTAKLNDTFESVAGVSITLDGKLRNIYDVVTDLGSKWQGLTREQQMYIAQEAVGIRQAGEFVNLITQYKTAISATEVALNSQGSALEENAKYMDSVSGKAEAFTSALQGMWTNLISSDSLKLVIEMGTELIKFTNNVGLLTIAFVAFMGVLIKVNGLNTVLAFGLNMSSVAMGKLTLSSVIGTKAMTALGFAMKAIPIIALVSGLIAIVNGISDANKATEAYNRTLEENKARISNIIYTGEIKEIEDTIDAIKRAQEAIESYQEAIKSGSFRMSGGAGSSIDEEYKEAKQTLAEYGLTVEDVSGRLATLTERLKEKRSAEAASTAQTRLGSQMLEDLRANVSDVVDIQETYSDLTQTIADGQKVSGVELLNLIQKYPELSKYMDENNDLLLTKDMLEKTVWETEKSIAVKRMETIKEEMIARQNSLKTLLADYETVYSIGSQLSGQSAAIFMQKISAAKKELDETTKSILEADASIKIISGMKLSEYTPSKEKKKKDDKKDILSNFKAQEKAVSDLSFEIDILGKKIEIAEGAEKVALQEKSLELYEKQQDAVHAYSDAIRALIAKGGLSAEELETLNEKLQDNGREWWSIETAIKSVADAMENDLIKATEELLDAQEKITKSLEDDLKKVIEGRNKSLEDQIDALENAQKIEDQINEDLDNQIKRQEILAEIAQTQLDIIKKKSELENIQNQKTVRMLNVEGTAFTLIADPKAIADKNEEIGKLNENMADLNNDLREHDLSVARIMADRLVEIEKAKLQSQIDANKLALETITDITGQELDKQGALWATFASGVDLELQGIISTIMTAIGLQQSLTGQINGVATIPAPTTVLGGTTTVKKGMNFDSMYKSSPTPVSNNTNKNSTVNNNTPITVANVILPNVTNGKNFAVELKDQILTNK